MSTVGQHPPHLQRQEIALLKVLQTFDSQASSRKITIDAAQ